MKKRGAILAISLPLLVCGLIWYSNKEFTALEESHIARQQAVPVTQAEIAVSAEKNAFDAQEATEVPSRSAFASHEGLTRLQNVIQEASLYTDTDTRQADFAKSGEDTPANFDAAWSVLTKPYLEPVSTNQAKEKALALHFLEITKQLDSITSCTATLDELEESLRNAKDEKTKMAVALDAGDLSTICLDIDESGLRSYVNERPESQVKSQILAQIGDNI